MNPQANQRVGEYVLDQPIGRGSFGEVWRARHHVWVDQLVAVKIPTDPQYVRNLQREGINVHGLQHPNIVRAIGFDPYASTPYLAMEYVPGTSLRPLIQQKQLTADQAVAILRQVLAGLAYAHERGMVHRDVKPENILIHETAADSNYGPGTVKVTDFDLGKAAAKTIVGSIAYSQSIRDDAGKEIAGTLDYMAPEQRAGSEPTAKADLYACGVILYEMLTGEKPAGTEVPSDLRPGTPRRLDEAFRRSYARLEKRFDSAQEFARALEGSGPPPIPPRAPAAHRDVAGAPRSPAQPANRTACPNCRQRIDPSDQFCMHCGLQLVPQVRRCDKCGGFPDPNDRFCIFCGHTLVNEGVTA